MAPEPVKLAEPTKLCKHCKTEIPKKASKCRHCGASQTKLWLAALLVVACFVIYWPIGVVAAIFFLIGLVKQL